MKPVDGNCSGRCGAARRARQLANVGQLVSGIAQELKTANNGFRFHLELPVTPVGGEVTITS
jgi:hypothetical protein